jgi:hypothetical protein
VLLYRVENLVDGKGLWYDSNTGEATGLIGDLDLTNKALPMGATEFLSGENWRSAAGSVDQLKFWFTHEDLQKLIPLGFTLQEIDAEIVKEHKTEWYTHPIFQEIGVKSRNQLDINILL